MFFMSRLEMSKISPGSWFGGTRLDAAYTPARLSHRNRNTLAIVQSIAHHSLTANSSAAEFVESFEGRLRALAAAHTLLVQSKWEGAELGEMARSSSSRICRLIQVAFVLRASGSPPRGCRNAVRARPA